MINWEEKMTATERMFDEIERQGKRQSDLCRRLGITTSMLAGWKKKNSIPPAWHLVGICDFLNVTTDWLLTGTGRKHPDTNCRILTDAQKAVAHREYKNLIEEQVALINSYEKLTSAEKDEVWVLINHMIARKSQEGTQSGLSSNSQTSKDGSSGSKTA